MLIHVTAQDIEESGYKARDNPITRAVQRETQQQWIVFDGHTAHELTPPYQSVTLPEHISRHWRRYQESGIMEPFEFEFLVKASNSTSLLAAKTDKVAGRDYSPYDQPELNQAVTTAPTSAQVISRAAATLAHRTHQIKDRRRNERRRDERRSFHDRRRGSRINAPL